MRIREKGHTQPFLDKERRDKKQGVFEKAKPTLRLGLRFVGLDDFRIAHVARVDIGADHKAGPCCLRNVIRS